MGPSIQRAVQKNQIFTVISADPASVDPISKAPPLFGFANRFLEIGDWTFDLSPAGQRAPDKAQTPPIFLMKFYPGKSIEDLVAAPSLWSEPDTFNVASFTATQAQAYLTGLIASAKAAVYPKGPNTPPDETSLYYNFYQTVTDPAFSGILVVNCNMQLDLLPPAIRAVLGGMKDPGIQGFRVHHIGVAINDTDPAQALPTLSKSAMFGLVDYEGTPTTPASPYDFEVEYLRALFLNSELRSFACQVNLTLDNLFKVDVTLQPGKAPDVGKNVIPIMGSYQANSGAGGSGAEGVYSFVAQGDFSFDFGTNSYLKSIALTKLQFSFDQEGTGQKVHCKDYTAITSPISAHFGIWGSLTFNDLKVLDVFSFEQLTFSNLGINVAFDLTTYVADPGTTPALPQPSTSAASLTFAPGDLRLDLANSPPRESGSSLLKLLPFKLKSFHLLGDGGPDDREPQLLFARLHSGPRRKRDRALGHVQLRAAVRSRPRLDGRARRLAVRLQVQPADRLAGRRGRGHRLRGSAAAGERQARDQDRGRADHLDRAVQPRICDRFDAEDARSRHAQLLHRGTRQPPAAGRHHQHRALRAHRGRRRDRLDRRLQQGPGWRRRGAPLRHPSSWLPGTAPARSSTSIISASGSASAPTPLSRRPISMLS